MKIHCNTSETEWMSERMIKGQTALHDTINGVISRVLENTVAEKEALDWGQLLPGLSDYEPPAEPFPTHPRESCSHQGDRKSARKYSLRSPSPGKDLRPLRHANSQVRSICGARERENIGTGGGYVVQRTHRNKNRYFGLVRIIHKKTSQNSFTKP